MPRAIGSRGRPEAELGSDGRPVSQLGATVRAWRRYYGWSSSDLAQRSGVSSSYISQLENGFIQQAGHLYLDSIAGVFGITARDLIDCKVPLSEIPDGGRPRITTSAHLKAIVVDDSLSEYTSPELETAKLGQLQIALRDYGATVLGIDDIPTSSKRIRVNNIHWDVSLVHEAEFVVPSSVYSRICELESKGIFFRWWLWAENRVPFGQMFSRNLLLIGVVETESDRGVWCILGKWLQ